MQYLLLGKTRLRVSRIALGTAAFGLPEYGIQAPDEPSALSEAEAVRLVQAASEQGINFFDTARGYGDSEAILGKGLAGCQSCVIATKVGIPADHNGNNSGGLTRAVMESLETSLRALRRDVLDIVQIHNATAKDLEVGEVLSVLEHARKQGKLKYVGASVYGEEAALAAIQSGRVDVLQIAVNLLDQRMMNAVLPAATEANVGIIARSALLKGALTERVKLLPQNLRALADAASRTREMLGETWESLPRAALRFCLSVPSVHSVLVGLRSLSELPDAMAAEAEGPLSDATMSKVSLLKLSDENLLNPSHWPSL
jgi:aryl-alcohol dehydrogenase-like predicted oxidoreductase